MRTFIVAAAMAAAVSVAPASASSVTYTYKSQSFGYPDDSGQWVPCSSQPYVYECMPVGASTGETGTLTISGPYPGGRIAGSTLLLEVFDTLSYDAPCVGLGRICAVYTVTRPDGSVLTGSNAGMQATFPFVQHTGYISNFLWGTVYTGYFAVEFDNRGQIVSWSGSNFDGGDFDPSTGGDASGTGRDIFEYGAYTLGQGTWTGIAAVPVPATGGLLASCMAAALWLRRRRLRPRPILENF